jgi:hypothetical protein
MMRQPGRQLSMTTPYAVLIPPKHRLYFGSSPKLGVGLVQRRPTFVS